MLEPDHIASIITSLIATAISTVLAFIYQHTRRKPELEHRLRKQTSIRHRKFSDPAVEAAWQRHLELADAQEKFQIKFENLSQLSKVVPWAERFGIPFRSIRVMGRMVDYNVPGVRRPPVAAITGLFSLAVIAAACTIGFPLLWDSALLRFKESGVHVLANETGVRTIPVLRNSGPSFTLGVQECTSGRVPNHSLEQTEIAYVCNQLEAGTWETDYAPEIFPSNILWAALTLLSAVICFVAYAVSTAMLFALHWHLKIRKQLSRTRSRETKCWPRRMRRSCRHGDTPRIRN